MPTTTDRRGCGVGGGASPPPRAPPHPPYLLPPLRALLAGYCHADRCVCHVRWRGHVPLLGLGGLPPPDYGTATSTSGLIEFSRFLPSSKSTLHAPCHILYVQVVPAELDYSYTVAAPLAQARRVSRVYCGFRYGSTGGFQPPPLSHTLAAATLPTRRGNRDSPSYRMLIGACTPTLCPISCATLHVSTRPPTAP